VNGRARFGLFEFDAATGALTREGVPVRLQPQPARVLAILVAHAGEVVTRDALRQEVWNDGTFVDFERGLNFGIAQIRSALGDSADAPRFVETLPRRGYRFIAPVTSIEQRLRPERGAESPRDPSATLRVALSPSKGESERGWAASAEATASPASIENSEPSASRQQGPRLATRRRIPVAALIGLALVTAALVGGAWRAASADRRVRVAVVPFDNETGMEEFDLIARGVADATVARLATPERVTALSVIGNAAALHRPRAFRDLQRIGNELDADYIVLAQMKRDATGVRLIAHLIRVRDQSHLWAKTYDRSALPPEAAPDRGFTLEMQAEIAESIASEVARTLAPRPSHRA
jgi:DNA-binding winged helix-turn-helix (wHTH) protein/TolB-like protein